MAKINRGYTSFFEYLVEEDFPLTRKLHKFFYPDEHDSKFSADSPYQSFRWNHTPYAGEKILGGFQPFVDIKDELAKFITPYKSTSHSESYELSHMSGMIFNPLKGAISILAAPLGFIINTLRYPFIKGEKQNFSEYMKDNASRSLGWLIDGISTIARSVIQQITIPLSAIRMAARFVVTLFKDHQKIEDTNGVKTLLQIADQNQSDHQKLKTVAYELHRKFNKHTVITGNSLDEPVNEADIRFSSIDKMNEGTVYQKAIDDNGNLLSYISLFKPVELGHPFYPKAKTSSSKDSAKQLRSLLGE